MILINWERFSVTYYLLRQMRLDVSQLGPRGSGLY